MTDYNVPQKLKPETFNFKYFIRHILDKPTNPKEAVKYVLAILAAGTYAANAEYQIVPQEYVTLGIQLVASGLLSKGGLDLVHFYGNKWFNLFKDQSKS